MAVVQWTTDKVEYNNFAWNMSAIENKSGKVHNSQDLLAIRNEVIWKVNRSITEKIIATGSGFLRRRLRSIDSRADRRIETNRQTHSVTAEMKSWCMMPLIHALLLLLLLLLPHPAIHHIHQGLGMIGRYAVRSSERSSTNPDWKCGALLRGAYARPRILTSRDCDMTLSSTTQSHAVQCR